MIFFIRKNKKYHKKHPSGCFLFYVKIINLIIALNIQKIGGAKIITE